ncbi:protein IQ-DOMAIN 12 [Cornus florida]|uniref:protein IQ-DOMAIN 12 n=1 Tax=Cornus florida TaxID=4283 RepID=UPI00289BBA4B|nr:protein IQ-DOMAIN 12 [Cornus florida]XP_059646250.1 protein IQ-DOMAIN 12 [Cornus florida]
MGKKRSCFSLVNRLCVSEAQPNTEKKSNKWRWAFGRLKQSPAIAAGQKTLSEATEEQKRHALAVAIATAAAAEAAVAAANAAAETVRLTCSHQSSNDYDMWTRNLAATKIQTAYRAHLARKAMKALKGLVKLQAIVRGQIVRRQVITKLKYLPSLTNAPSQFHQMRVPNADERCKDGEKKHFPSSKKSSEAKEMKLEYNSRSWDYSLSLREDAKALRSRKQEAIIKKDRMKKYSVSHWERRSDQSPEKSKLSKEHSHLLEECENAETYKRRETEKLRSTIHSKSTASETYGTRFKLRNAYKHDSVEESNSPSSLPRRSFCRTKQKSIGNESSLPNSPVFPTYMAATESAKAKARSMSTPKQRLGFLDTYSGHTSPQKIKLSPWSSFNGEVTCTNGRSGTFRYSQI